MKVKSLIAFVLAGMLGASAMVSCAPQKATPETTPESKEAVAEESKAEESKTEEGGGTTDAAAKISFWKWIPTEGSQTDDLVKQWKTQYPNIELDITHIGESEAHFQKLSAALAAGEGPSVLALQVGARANQFKEFCAPMADKAAAKWGDDWEGKFLDAALEQCRYSGDNYTVLPGGMTATPVFQYNAVAFEKLGITKTPSTMDEIYDVIEKSKSDDQIIPGIGIGAKEGWTCRDVFMAICNQVAPGKVYEAQEGKASFEDPAFVEAFKIWQELFTSGFFAEGSLGVSLYPDINDNFGLAGTDGNKYYIMENCGTWHGSGLTNKAVDETIEKGTRADYDTLKIGAFTLPAVKDGADPNMVVTVDVAWGVNNAKDQAEQDAAFEFVSWMSAEEGQEIWCNSLQVLPCAKDISLDTALNDMAGESEKAALEMFQKYVENNSGAREIKYAEIATAMNDALPAVAGGTMTPEAACASLEAASKTAVR